MARIGPMNVTDGNKTYQFVVYDLEGPEYNAPGVYIFSKGSPNVQGGNNHQFLYIGQTEGLEIDWVQVIINGMKHSIME